MRKKLFLIIVLTIMIVVAGTPFVGPSYTAYAASATTPAKVSRDEAMTRLQNLVTALKGEFFTTTGKTCHTPAEKSHYCTNCNIGNVVTSSWFKKKVDLVPNMSVVSISHYAPGGSTLKNGWSCAGFANFAGWYVYAQKSTDQVTFSKFYDDGKDTKAVMAKCRPGDIIRTSAGHSMVFIQNLANVDQYQVLDCNWCTVGSSVGNCKIQVRSINYSSNTVAISRAKNLKDEVKLLSYLNYSGKNYLYETDFKSISDKNWTSTDDSITGIFTDSANTHNGNNSLKIVNYSAGENGKGMTIRTMTQSRILANYIGDKKNMILSFWAKASSSGTKMFFRWGFESADDTRSVSLSTSWAKYTIRMDKVQTFSKTIHTYINKAGTVWLSEMQLEDGSSATSFVPETGGEYQTVSTKFGNNYTLPTEPTRPGYTFAGWYTQPAGGSKITSSTAAKNGHINIFAHWTLGSPSISSQPSSVSTVKGNTAAFNVSASGAELAYLWQWRSSASGSWTDCTSSTQGYNTASLNVSAETARDGYQYRCKVMNSAGTTYSNTATLRVFGVTKQPSSINTLSGRTATFSVAASGNVTGYQWQWRTSAAGSWTNSTSATAGYNTANLTVSAESKRNGYQYRCKVTDVNGNTVYSAPATLKVLGILTQPTSVSAAVGETAIFKVVATGDNRTYQWQWRPSASSSWQNCTSATQGYNTASLKVSAETKRNGYQYRCIVTNGSGSITSKTVTLTIESAVSKPVITSHPKNATVGQGSTVVFGVIASGNNLSYKWQWSSDGGKTWKDSTSATAGYNTSSIKVNAETFRNNYRYRCIVSNKAGSVTSNAAVLIVQ